MAGEMNVESSAVWFGKSSNKSEAGMGHESRGVFVTYATRMEE